jgi:hypothetical protein
VKLPFLSNANLVDFKELDALKTASREDLEAWYLFQSQCLFALISKHGRDGTSIIVDARDAPLGSWKMFVMPLNDYSCALVLREVPSDTVPTYEGCEDH